MPLPDAVESRQPIHTREMECSSFVRDDGLVDIEGHLTDVKSYSFPNEFRGEIKAGEPLHDMWIRLTVDSGFVIRAVETAMDGTPFALCPDILPAFDQLVGLRIAPGWNRHVRKRLGSVRGCAHMVDLLRPMATVAFHTAQWSRAAPRSDAADAGKSKDAEKSKKEALPLNSCHAWASDGEIIRTRYPDLYTG